MPWPEVIVPEASGPSESSDGSTPVTVNELVLRLPDGPLLLLPPRVPPLPLPPLAAKVPDSFMSLSTRAPTAALTCFWSAAAVTDDDLSVPSPPPTRRSRLTVEPLPLDWAFLKLRAGPPPEPAVGDLVTVISVPTPYSDLSTAPCEAET